MTSPLRFLSVCSGIEAASQALGPLGFQATAFSEIDKFACAYLAHRHPTVPNWGDMTKFQEWPDADLDVLCGGTPCQSFSVAGLRQGLADPRGNLMLTFGAIAARYRPRWILWENVPGVLSSDGGRDFASLLGLLSGQQIIVPSGGWQNAGIIPGIGDAYGLAYRVLDAQFVRTRGKPRAVPQRRRRVFVVGYLGDWRRAAAVLFDAESLRRDTPPRREAGKGVAPCLASRPTGGGRGSERAGDTRGQDPVVAFQANSGEAAYCLTASAQQSLDAETETLVAHTLRGEGFDATEDGTGRGTPLVAHPLTAGMHKSAARMPHEQGTLVPIAIQERAVSDNPAAGPDGVGVRQDGAAYTLEARTVTQAVAYGLSTQQEPKWQSDVAPTLALPSKTGGGQTTAVAFDMRGREGGSQLEGPHDTAAMRAAAGGSSRSYVAQIDPSGQTPYTEGNRHEGHHGTATETDAAKLLRGVRDAIGEEALSRWGLGVLEQLCSPEVLRQALHGSELRPATFSTSWLVNCALSRPENRGGGAVQSLREAGSDGRASHGWQPLEQRSVELGAYLSELSQPGPQAERFMLDLWSASEGIGVLRQALSAVQAARRSIGRKDQPTHGAWAVRRLTPAECEFLMAMPRGITNIPWRGKPTATDGNRYKALGNSWATNCVEWIGERLLEVDGWP